MNNCPNRLTCPKMASIPDDLPVWQQNEKAKRRCQICREMDDWKKE